MIEIRVEYDILPLDMVEAIAKILKDLDVNYEVTLTENKEGYIIKYEKPQKD